MGDCVADDVDDVGFLERVAQAVQRKYAGAGKLFVSGNSAGGMMVYHLLCQSAWFARNLAAASVFSGGMGEKYECKGPGAAASKRVPLIVLHGQADDVIGYQKGTNVDGAPFLATTDAVKGWVARRGCVAEGSELHSPFFAAQKIECRDYCVVEEQKEEQVVKEQGHVVGGAGAKNKNAGGASSSSSSSKLAQKNKNGSGARNLHAASNANSNAAPMRVCSVPGRKHNLYDVMRSFPLDVSGAWFAKAQPELWGPMPPSR